MKSAHRATKISLALTMGVVYPFGTKVALTDWDECQ
jgi:hypothetical protein